MSTAYVGYNHHHDYYYDQGVMPPQDMFEPSQPRSWNRHSQHESFAQFSNDYGHSYHEPQSVWPDKPSYLSNSTPRPTSSNAIEDDSASYSPSSSPISRHSSDVPASPPSMHPKDIEDRAYCSHLDCQDERGNPIKFFSRKADVARHVRSAHERRFIDCPMKRCDRKGDRGFTRNDHLVEHRRQYHMEPIPKKGGRRESGSSSGSGASGKGRHSA